MATEEKWFGVAFETEFSSVFPLQIFLNLASFKSFKYTVFCPRYVCWYRRILFKMTSKNNVFGIHVGYIIVTEDNSFH